MLYHTHSTWLYGSTASDVKTRVTGAYLWRPDERATSPIDNGTMSKVCPAASTGGRGVTPPPARERAPNLRIRINLTRTHLLEEALPNAEANERYWYLRIRICKILCSFQFSSVGFECFIAIYFGYKLLAC